MKNLKSIVGAVILSSLVTSTVIAKSGTISTTRTGTISTTKSGTISTTRTGTISTTRGGTISTTRTENSLASDLGVLRAGLLRFIVEIW